MLNYTFTSCDATQPEYSKITPLGDECLPQPSTAPTREEVNTKYSSHCGVSFAPLQLFRTFGTSDFHKSAHPRGFAPHLPPGVTLPS